MKKYALLIGVICLCACGQPSPEGMEQDGDNQENVASATDHFLHKAEPEYARHFTVSYHGNYKVVKTNATFYPTGQTKEVEEGEDRNDLVVLVQRGTPAPALTGGLQGAQLITVPVETAAVNVQHSESYLRELGLVDRLIAIGGLYSYDDEMRGKAMSGEIGQIGYSWHSPPNLEVLLERNPALFLMTLASMAHTESLEKSRQLGIPTAAVFDWAEQDYLARAEWLKFYALFFNAEEAANRVFGDIKNRVEELKALAAGTDKQSAIWGYHTSKGRWLMQLTSFPAQYMRDANLDNVLLKNTEPNANGLQALTTEQLLLRGKDAAHWVIGDIHAAPLPGKEIMSSFAAWNTGKLYQNTERVDPKSNSSDWYATAIVRPDSVLADLIRLVHGELLPGHQPVFMGIYEKPSQDLSLRQ